MKKFYLIFITIFCINIVYSQDIVFSASKEKSAKIKYGEGGTYNNSIIKKLAEWNNENYNSYKVNVDFTLNKEISRYYASNTLKISLDNIKIEGKYLYRSFGIKKKLMPSKIRYKIEYFENDVSTKIVEKESSFKMGNIAEEIIYIVATDVENAKFRFKVSNIILIYDYNNKLQFDKRVELIDAYYRSCEQLKKEIAIYENIVIDETVLSSLEDLQEVFDFKDIAIKTEELINTTKRQSFYTQLSINNNDPEGLNADLNTLKEKSTKLITVCNNIIQKLDIIYYDRGMVMLAKNDVRMAQFYFNKSIEQNKNFSPAHYQIAKINFDNQNFEEAYNLLLKIYNMNPDIETINKSNSLAQLIFIEYINKGEKLNAQRRYKDALVWFDKANKVCRNIKAVSCSSDLNNGYQTAVSGIFNNLLANVDNSINAKNLKKAESDLQVAIQYRADHIEYLPDNQVIINKHNQIYTEYYLMGNTFLNNKKYEKALVEYSNAERICKRYNYINCTEELNKAIFDSHTGVYTQKVDLAKSNYNAKNLDKAEQYLFEAEQYQINHKLNKDSRFDQLLIDIKQTRYKNNIAEGQKQVKYQNYESALTFYNKAKELENNYKIIKNVKLDSYIDATAKSFILQTIEKGEKKVNVNDLTSAKELLQKAIELQNLYNLKSDNEIIIATEALSGKIFKQECLNYKAEYDSNYQKAITFIFEKNYIKADEFLYIAINVVESHQECMLDASNADYKKQEIANAVTYQKLIAEAGVSYGRTQFQATIDKYVKAKEYYDSNRIGSKYSLEHVDLFDYIKERSNEFINHSVAYYTNNDELDNALSLLNVLKQRFYKNKYTKNNQKALAYKLAIRDHQENASLYPKVKVLEYTAGDKWFKYLKKEYKKRWKKL